MGTNYYMHTKDKRLVSEDFPWEYNLTDCPEFGYEIHICKMSGGWKTLFQTHNFAYTSVKEMVKYFRKNEDKINIYDEYGEKQDLDKFIDICLNRDKENMKNNNHKFVWEVSDKSNLRMDDTATKDFITTPFDHIEYGEFEKSHGKTHWVELLSEYWNDDEGYNFMNRDFS